jgi:hypothetical protein
VDTNTRDVITGLISAVSFLSFSGMAAWTVVRLRRLREHGQGTRASAASEERLARLEQAVDTVALEMERSSEAQRFTARLLAERLGELAPRVPERAAGQHRPNNTPH